MIFHFKINNGLKYYQILEDLMLLLVVVVLLKDILKVYFSLNYLNF